MKTENNGQSVKSFKVDKLSVNVYRNRQDLGQVVADTVAVKMPELLTKQDQVAMVLAAAASQNEFLDYLGIASGIDWPRVVVFHMDEYIGLPDKHPQRFANYLSKQIFDRVKPGKVHFLDGNSNPPELEINRYTKLLQENPLDIACIGIGENGHIAFNDPAFADFKDPYLVKLVEPDLTSRLQQVHDGCFHSLEEVPTQAYTLTIPALIAAKWIYCSVPGPTKRQAVKKTLEGPISTSCPASILRTFGNTMLFLDEDSAKDI